VPALKSFSEDLEMVFELFASAIREPVLPNQAGCKQTQVRGELLVAMMTRMLKGIPKINLRK